MWEALIIKVAEWKLIFFENFLPHRPTFRCHVYVPYCTIPPSWYYSAATWATDVVPDKQSYPSKAQLSIPMFTREILRSLVLRLVWLAKYQCHHKGEIKWATIGHRRPKWSPEKWGNISRNACWLRCLHRWEGKQAVNMVQIKVQVLREIEHLCIRLTTYFEMHK